jgi:galactokinase/mevalonate kinase-like predicted kinase
MEIEAVLLSQKTLGFKLLGAGGGGFVLGMMQDLDAETRKYLSKWSTFSPELDHLGTRIISIN